MTDHVVIVGGGITGLAAAWEALEQGHRVTVHEAGPRFGGLISTAPVDVPGPARLMVDEGADAFLARVPDALELCEQLGLGDQLCEPAVGRAMVHTADGLRWFPERSVLGVPTDVDALASTGLLSEAGLDRVRAAASISQGPPTADVAVGPFLRERFGDELVDRVVGPLVGGISAGDIDQMSLFATTPQIAAAALEGGPLSESLARRTAATPPGPVFNGLRGGTGSLVSALVDQLTRRGGDLRPGSALGREDIGGLRADLLVLTTPAAVTSSLVAQVSPAAAEALASIETASVALTTLAYPRAAFDWPSDASGYLVPRSSGLFLTAVSWGSTKWPHWGDGSHAIVRASTGHRGDDRFVSMDDDAVVDAIRADLELTCGLVAEPDGARVSRWIDGFHQYDVGHLDLVQRIQRDLDVDTAGRIRLAGASLHGVGIPACIRSGRSAVLGGPTVP